MNPYTQFIKDFIRDFGHIEQPIKASYVVLLKQDDYDGRKNRK